MLVDIGEPLRLVDDALRPRMDGHAPEVILHLSSFHFAEDVSKRIKRAEEGVVAENKLVIRLDFVVSAFNKEGIRPGVKPLVHPPDDLVRALLK